MKGATKKLIMLFAAMILAGFGAQQTKAATLTVSPGNGTYKVGQTFSVNINVDPGSENVDTVRAKLSYSSQQLEIERFSLNSKYSFSTGGNGYDNNSGTFSYGAGVPGGTSEGGTFGTVVFKVKAPGEAKVAIGSDSLVLSSGENTLNGPSPSASFNLVEPESKPAPPASKEKDPANSAPAGNKASGEPNGAEATTTPVSEAEDVSNSPFQQQANPADLSVVMLNDSQNTGKVQINSAISKKKLIIFAILGLVILLGAGAFLYIYIKRKRRPKFSSFQLDDL